MNRFFEGARLWAICRVALLVSVASSNVAMAQYTQERFQLCESIPPDRSTAPRIETSYRYPSSGVTRKPGLSTICEAAWAQSWTPFFEALQVCFWWMTDCTRDVDRPDTCADGSGTWHMRDLLAARRWTDEFTSVNAWSQNPDIDVFSDPIGFDVWTRHMTWEYGVDRYEYLGVIERPMGMYLSGLGRPPRCFGMAYVVGLFNGVWTSPESAYIGIRKLASHDFIGAKYRGAPVLYHVFYNQTGCSRTNLGCIDDIAEVFIQRSAELDGALGQRWEYFWELLTKADASPRSFTATLSSYVLTNRAFKQWLGALADAVMAKMTALAAGLVANPPTAVDIKRQVGQLVSFGQQGYRAVLVGHSQGNLFASAAKEGYLKHASEAAAIDGQDTGYVAAEIVHVAPASAVLRGPHVLAEIDLVINGIRLVDGSPVAANTLGRDAMPTSLVDPSGHMFVQTYLDPNRPARAEVKKLIVQAMDAL